MLPLLDAVVWAAAVVAAAVVADGAGTRPRGDLLIGSTLAPLVTLAVGLQLALGLSTGLYRQRFPRASIHEVRLLLAVVLTVGAVVTGIAWLSTSETLPTIASTPLGIAAPLLTAPLAFTLMGCLRATSRVLAERARRPGPDAARTLVFGAGHAGARFVTSTIRDPKSAYLPVGFLDDDPRLRRFAIDSVLVHGNRGDIAEVASELRATTLVIAVSEPPRELVEHLGRAARSAGLRLLVIPTPDEMLRDGDRVSDLRDVSAEEIIGRCPLDLDVLSAASYLRGKRVLVTGAGGSIGSELCRQIAALSPSELIMLDRDETALQAVQVSISGHGLLDTDDVVLADIRDDAAITSIFDARRPQVVFHAAALKHLPMLEQYPAEGWKTNVLGTLTVLEAARRVQVETFVNVSTDKAANASSALGRSKRLAERLTADAAVRGPGRYLSVRFGNVLGSRGSMLPLFRQLIEAGRPVTVTDPEATRYFMTVPEACQLVVHAGGIGGPGEVLILDMGEPVRILDIARRLIDLSGRDVDIVFTGLRPGEKLHEELVGEGETDLRPVHPKISHTSVPPLAPHDLRPQLYDAPASAPAPADAAVPAA